MKAVKILLCLTLLCGCVGCTSKTGDHGTWTIAFSQSVSFDSIANDSGDAVATAGFDANDWLKGGILSWLFGSGEEETETDTRATSDTGDGVGAVEVTVAPDGG